MTALLKSTMAKPFLSAVKQLIGHFCLFIILFLHRSLLRALLPALDFLKYEHNNFVSKGSLPGFNESSQFVAIDNNNIVWVAHPYRGVFKIDMSDTSNPKSKIYTDKNGLPSSFNNHLFKIKNRIVVATEKGIYEYNPSADKFELSDYFKSTFGQKNIRHLKEDSSGKYLVY